MDVEAGGAGGLLGALSDEDRQALVAIARRRAYPPGAVLFAEGDPARNVIFVQGGLVKLTKAAADGREIVIELRGAGEVLGELAAIDGLPRSASAVVVEPADVLLVGTDRFRELVAARASLAGHLLRIVAARLREASTRQLELGTLDGLGRVARRLAELAERRGRPVDGTVVVSSPISQQELAEWAGVSRDAAVRALSRLRSLGWVETGRRHFVVHDLAALRRAAEW